jgi:acyl CoA:acetate/3-ketoacid CoA transferase
MRLEPAGLRVMEIAPGVNLERDVLAQSEFPLLVSPELKVMEATLFYPAPIRLQLRPAMQAAP